MHEAREGPPSQCTHRERCRENHRGTHLQRRQPVAFGVLLGWGLPGSTCKRFREALWAWLESVSSSACRILDVVSAYLKAAPHRCPLPPPAPGIRPRSMHSRRRHQAKVFPEREGGHSKLVFIDRPAHLVAVACKARRALSALEIRELKGNWKQVAEKVTECVERRPPGPKGVDERRGPTL